MSKAKQTIVKSPEQLAAEARKAEADAYNAKQLKRLTEDLQKDQEIVIKKINTDLAEYSKVGPFASATEAGKAKKKEAAESIDKAIKEWNSALDKKEVVKDKLGSIEPFKITDNLLQKRGININAIRADIKNYEAQKQRKVEELKEKQEKEHRERQKEEQDKRQKEQDGTPEEMQRLKILQDAWFSNKNRMTYENRLFWKSRANGADKCMYGEKQPTIADARKSLKEKNNERIKELQYELKNPGPVIKYEDPHHTDGAIHRAGIKRREEELLELRNKKSSEGQGRCIIL